MNVKSREIKDRMFPENIKKSVDVKNSAIHAQNLFFSKTPIRQWGVYLLAITVNITFYIDAVVAQVPISDYYCTTEVVGYYPDYLWIPIPDIRYDKYTHVVFFSIFPNPDGSLNTSQIDLDRQADFVEVARSNDVGVQICIGGWNLSDGFSPMAANLATRAVFIDNLKNYCINFNYDGVVLDWEPVSNTTDRSNYTLLIQELKAALSSYELSLTVAVFAQGSEFYTDAIDSIDRLHIMAYDMSSDPSLPHSTYEDAIAGVLHWETFGFDRDKIILGLPFYGRNANWKYYDYDDIIAHYAPPPDVDEVNGVHFNGINTIRKKTRFVVDNQYRGVMCWELTQDTHDTTSLLDGIADEVLLRRRPDFNCDQIVNYADLDYFARQWLMSDCRFSNSWCDACDLDHSGTVSLEDLGRLASNWMIN